MDDTHNKSTELSLDTEGAILSEQEIRQMNKMPEVDFPMPGEVAHPEEHQHQTLKEIEDDQKESKVMDCD
jgi:hypothetical protein